MSGHSHRKRRMSQRAQPIAEEDTVAKAVCKRTPAHALRNTSYNKNMVVLQCCCNQPGHTQFMQFRSAIKKRQTWAKQHNACEDDYPGLYCKRCNYLPGDGMEASGYEHVLYWVFYWVFFDLNFHHEVYVLGRMVDAWIPDVRLLVMVDGEQHFTSRGRGHHGSSAQEQCCSDAAFDEKVMANGGAGMAKGLVRLHYEDAPTGNGGAAWVAAISQALHHARDPKVACFVVYSRAYRKLHSVQMAC